ncbi:MAG: hypothetical protein JXR94_09305, partial [Candidatus Hydrogenedentes bacterium]|nr:hypothetical protein [Candidatus Hydrogenedentota bacterium]
PFAEDYGTELVCSNPALMAHNRAVWRFRTDDRPNLLLGWIMESLKEAGWKKLDLAVGEGQQPYLRMAQEDWRVAVVGEPPGELEPEAPEQEAPAEQLFHVYYAEFLSREELRMALLDLFEADAPPATLVPFRQHLNRAGLHAEFESAVTGAQPDSVATALMQAHILQRRNDTEGGRRALADGIALLRMAEHLSGRYTDEIYKLGEELGLGKRVSLDPDPAAMDRVGFIDWAASPLNAMGTRESQPREVPIGQPVVAYWAREPEGIETVSVRLEPAKERAKGLTLVQVRHRARGGVSWQRIELTRGDEIGARYVHRVGSGDDAGPLFVTMERVDADTIRCTYSSSVVQP